MFVQYLVQITDFSDQNYPLKLDSLSESFSILSFNYGYCGILKYLIQHYIINPADSLKVYITSFLKWCSNYVLSSKIRESSSLFFGIGYLPIILSEWGSITNDYYFYEVCKTVTKIIIALPNIQFNISHGISGVGIMLLKCYQNTSDKFYLNESKSIYEKLMSNINIDNNSLLWKTKHSEKKFNYFIGLSHGISGIGVFLILYFKYLPEYRNEDLIGNLINSIDRYKVVANSGSYLWPHTNQSNQEESWIFWCNGSTGVLWFLLFAHKYNYRHQKLNRLLKRGIQSIIESNIFGSVTICHGLMGSIELIDAIIKSGINIYNKKDIENKKDILIQRVLSTRIKQSTHTYWLSEDKEIVQLAYMTGVSGIYSVLLKEKYEHH